MIYRSLLFFNLFLILALSFGGIYLYKSIKFKGFFREKVNVSSSKYLRNYFEVSFLNRQIKKNIKEVKKEKSKVISANTLKNVKLFGILYPYYAILEKDKKFIYLKQGENITNCILKKIDKDKVIFNCTGEDFLLVLNLNPNNSKMKNSIVYSSKSYSSSFNGPSRKSSQSESFGKVRRVKRKEVINLISSGKIFYQMAVVPYYKNGKVLGFKVVGVKRNSFVYKMGIRKGDIILSINGYPIRSMEEGFAAFERLKDSSEINIRVLRRGREITLSYIIED